MIRRLLLISTCILSISPSCTRPEKIWIGTYGSHIYKAEFNKGQITLKDSLKAGDATWVHPGTDGILHAATRRAPDIYACSFDASGKRVGCSSELVSSACYINTIDGTPFVMTAEYGGGAISVFGSFEANNDTARCIPGAISEHLQTIRFHNSGPYSKRQTQSHIHQVKNLPESICAKAGIEGRWVLATDLGGDCIYTLKVNEQASAQHQRNEMEEGFGNGATAQMEGSGILIPAPHATIFCGSGSGPRHMEFDTRTGVLYCVTEISCEVLAWKISASERGEPLFLPISRIAVEGVNPEGGADIHLSADGRHLYASFRRGNDGIAIFKVHSDGSPEAAGYCNCASHPRNFHISADDRYLLVGSMDDALIQVFRRKRRTGALKPTGYEFSFTSIGNGSPIDIEDADKPVCIVSAE